MQGTVCVLKLSVKHPLQVPFKCRTASPSSSLPFKFPPLQISYKFPSFTHVQFPVKFPSSLLSSSLQTLHVPFQAPFISCLLPFKFSFKFPSCPFKYPSITPQVPFTPLQVSFISHSSSFHTPFLVSFISSSGSLQAPSSPLRLSFHSIPSTAAQPQHPLHIIPTTASNHIIPTTASLYIIPPQHPLHSILFILLPAAFLFRQYLKRRSRGDINK